MNAEKLESIGEALSKIGERIMDSVGGPPDGIYLYVEIGEGWVGPSLFRDEGDKIRYIDINDLEICWIIIDRWNLEPEGRRWTGMEYTVDGGEFKATFQFDSLETYDGTNDRRNRFLKARYGGRPIVYPPWQGSMELTPPS